VRKVGADPNSNNGKKPKWADYEDFMEDVDDFDDGGFEDEIIGHRKVFGSLETEGILGILPRANSIRKGNFRNFEGHDDVDGDLDAIKLKIHTFQVKNDPGIYFELEKKVD
jgi:hypothetical protein